MHASPASSGPSVRPGRVLRILRVAAPAALLAGCAVLGGKDYIAELARTARTPAEAGRPAAPPAFPFPAWSVDTGAADTQTLPLSPPESTRAMPYPMTYVRINGLRTFALIDTGSNVSLIDGRGALRTGVIPLRAEGPVVPDQPPDLLRSEGWGPGSHFKYILGAVDRLEFDTLGLRNGLIGILDQKAVLAPFGWVNATPAETLIGCDVLRSFSRVVLDIPSARMEVSLPGSAPEPPPRTGRHGRTPLVPGLDPFLPVVEVELSNGLRAPVVLDTGSDLGLCLPPTLARRAGVIHDPFRRGMVLIHTVGGEGAYWPADPLGVKLGGLDLGEVEVGVSVMRLHQREPPFGLLGLRALRPYRITLDFAEGHVELRR